METERKGNGREIEKENNIDKKINADLIGDQFIDNLIVLVQCFSSLSDKQVRQFLTNPENQDILNTCRAKLIYRYYSVVGEIRKDKRKLSAKDFRTNRRKYIKKLLTPLHKLTKLNPSIYFDTAPFGPFIPEWIWLDREINRDNLIYDRQNYHIDLPEKSRHFDPYVRNVYIHSKRTSISKIYEECLPTVTKDTIKSKDLLNQILVCFTIKRALNGDKKAIEKLHKLYEDTAINIATKMAYKRGLRDHIEDIKQEAEILLRLIISGFSPEEIVNYLQSDEKDQLLPLWIEKFYFWYLSEYIPQEIRKIQKCPEKYVPKRIQRIMKLPADVCGLKFVPILLNVYTPIQYNTSFKDTPKRVMRFNSYSFRPNKDTNLTTWLFGTGRGDMKSKLRQLISKSIDDYWKMKKEIPHELIEGKEDLNYRPLRLKTGFVCKQCKQNVLAYKQPNKCAEHDENQKIPIKRGRVGKKDKTSLDEKTLEMARNKLMESNIFKRNKKRCIEIVIQKLKGIGHNRHDFSYDSIAKKYNLTKRQVINICNKAKTP